MARVAGIRGPGEFPCRQMPTHAGEGSTPLLSRHGGENLVEFVGMLPSHSSSVPSPNGLGTVRW